MNRAANDKYVRITSATTTTVRTGPGTLKRIVVNTPVSTGTIGLVDNTTGTTVNIGTITSTADLKPYFIDYDLKLTLGLIVVTTQAQDVTVVYS